MKSEISNFHSLKKLLGKKVATFFLFQLDHLATYLSTHQPDKNPEIDLELLQTEASNLNTSNLLLLSQKLIKERSEALLRFEEVSARLQKSNKTQVRILFTSQFLMLFQFSVRDWLL